MRTLGLIFLTCSCWPVLADTTDVVKEVVGVGVTKHDAVTDALLEAVQQVKGAEIKTAQSLRVDLSSIVGKDGTALTTLTGEMDTRAINRAFGWVKTYDIVDVKRPSGDGKNWEVKLRVTVPLFESVIADDKRKKLVILPFTVTNRNAKLTDPRYTAHDFATQLSDGLINQFIHSERYTVLNREFLQQLQTEADLWASADVPSKEASRLGQKLGADLMLLGAFHKLDIVDKVKEFYGSEAKVKYVDVDVNYQIMEPATGKILWSNKYTHQDEIKVNQFSKFEKDIHAEVTSLLSQKIARAVLAQLFPVRVLDIQGSDIVLNQGEQNVKVGEQFGVYDKGGTVKDPDTGMAIDIRGSRKASIEVMQVNSNYSFAKVIDGDSNQVSVKSILTLVEQPPKPIVAAPSAETPGSSDKPFNWNR